MIIDSKAITLFVTALIIMGAGVLVSKGLLDAGTQTLIMGLLTGGATGGAAGYAVGRAVSPPPEQENGEPPNP